MQLTNLSKFKIIHIPGKKFSVADLLNRSFTKEELQRNKLKHKHLPPQIDFKILQNNTFKPGTDQFSLRKNDKSNDIIVKLLNSFSFKAVTPFQTKSKTPIKNIIGLFINNLSH